MITKLSSFKYSYNNRKGIDYNKLASENFKSSRYLSRLASAESRGAVIMLKSNLRSEIYKIKKSGGDELQIKAAVARIRKVMKKADEKIIKLSREKRIKERIKLAEYAEKIQEEQSLIKEYKSRVYNRKVSERLNVTRAAIYEEKETRYYEQYRSFTAVPEPASAAYILSGSSEMLAGNISAGEGNAVIDIMV